ncbi:hypothetical protein SDC9_96313 [bioreactor metagenome]|uniref:Uncharacterized protein n=1 Tax=bioreactor metagenome TaxID=1076179 RepID=A0A645AFH8_9ZZZZ
MRHPRCVAAQCGREYGRLGRPVVGRLGAGEGALAQPGQEDQVPFQSLGTVHGQQFDRFVAARNRLVESAALLAFDPEPGEQAAERAVPVDVDVLPHRVGEPLELAASSGVEQVHIRAQLQRYPAAVDHPVHEFEERLVAMPAQIAQLGGEGRQPPSGIVRDRRRAQVLHRIHQTQLGGWFELLADVGQGIATIGTTGGLRSAQQLSSPTAHDRKITRPDPPSGPAQQPHHLWIGGDIIDQLQRGDHIGDLRHLQQTAQADDLDRNITAHQGFEDRSDGRVRPGQHRDL